MSVYTTPTTRTTGDLITAAIWNTDLVENIKYLKEEHDLAIPTDLNAGWRKSADTWVYASAVSFTVSGVDRTSIYQKGTRIRWKDGGAYKYAVVTASSFSTNTTVTFTGGNDYTMANATITDNYYSYELSPQGYPDWFSYSPAWTASSSNPAIGNGSLAGKFKVEGRAVTCRARIVCGSTTTFGNGVYYLSIPVNVASTLNFVGSLICLDSFTTWYEGICMMSDAVNTVDFVVGNARVTQTVPFIWANGDDLQFTIVYEMA